MRAVVGMRLVLFGVGLNAASIGAVLALGHLGLRYPDARSAMNDPTLSGVVYDVPHWMLDVGLGLLMFGLVCLIAGWYSSPRWQGGPLHRRWGLAVSSSVISGWLASVVAVVLGRKSAEARFWLVFILAAPIVAVVMWFRESSRAD